MKLLLILAFFSSTAFATLEKLQIQSLNLDYREGRGAGDFQKLHVGIKSLNPTYPIEVIREENSFLIDTPFVTLEWLEPLKFLHNAQAIKASGVNMNLAKLNHSATGSLLEIKSEKGSQFGLSQFDLLCSGMSTEGDALDRFIEDCFHHTKLVSKKIELPLGINPILNLMTEDSELMSTGDVSLIIDQKKYDLKLNVKYVFSSTLKALGRFELENDGEILAIRIDSVKLGILPVTGIVFSELRRNEGQNMKVDPPWIRIKL